MTLRRVFMSAGALLVIVAGGWAWTHRAAPKLSGGIVLRTLQCGSSDGVAHVSALAMNDTNQILRGLVARVTVGHGSTTETQTISYDSVLKGGTIQVRQDIPQQERINVCYVKFWWNGTQVPTAFRP